MLLDGRAGTSSPAFFLVDINDLAPFVGRDSFILRISHDDPRTPAALIPRAFYFLAGLWPASSATGPTSRYRGGMAGVLTGRGFPLLTSVPPIDERESLVLDFKNERPRSSSFEPAKDVAAMANVQGGTILIGAVEGKGRLARFDPIKTKEDVSTILRAYEHSVRDRCGPSPTIDHEVFDCPTGGGELLAIHIMPSPAPIAVRVSGNITDGWGDDAWVFFQRIATHNKPVRPEVIRPEVLPVFMSPEIRHVAIILRSIPFGARVRLKQEVSSGSTARYGEGSAYSAVTVDELANTVVFATANDTTPIPLNFIRTVYNDGNEWIVLARSTIYAL